ncbi:MAG: MG2 domain-containing protein [Bacteroidota bacterium]
MKKNNLFVTGLILLFTQLALGSSISSQYPPTFDSLRIIEKVYLHIDRESYYPGDDIWFKAYLIDATGKLLTNNSMNLHVELISPDLKVIDSHIIRLDNGLGNGDFHLSEKIQSGRYRLRAYTNYMRNFGDQLFFNKDIIILNSSDALKAFSDSINYNKNKPEISFFPEGGSLVDDVTSLVGFKAVDATGKGCEISGKVYSSHGDTIASFNSTFKGMGTFNLNPAPGEQYYSIIYDKNGDSSKTQIRKSLKTGVVLNVSEKRPGELDLTIRTNKETLHVLTDHDLSLTVSVHSTILNTIFFRVKSLNSHMTLKTDEFPNGIVSLTIYDFEGKPFCERLAFVHNNDDAELTVKTDKPIYDTMDSVSVRISISNHPVQDAFLSLSASNEISEDETDLYSNNISSWFLLESDVHGNIETPSYYFDRSNADRLKNLDNLLLTQGWRDFKWKYENYFETENGFTISGRARKKLVNDPLDNSSVTLGIFEGKKLSLYLVPIDSTGRFFIKGIDFTGKTSLIASVTNDKDKLKGWLILDSLNYIPEKVHIKNVNIRQVIKYDPIKTISKSSVEFNDSLKNYKSNNNLRKKYKLSDTIEIGEVIINPKPKFEPWNKLEPYLPRRQNEMNLRTLFPDRELPVTADLEIYNSLAQLLSMKLHIYYNDRPQVVEVNGFRTTQVPGKSSCNKMTNPLTMLNGMEVGYEYIESIPINMVEKIYVLCPINGELQWGERGGNGVVSILLKSDWSSTTITYHSVNKSITGYNEPRIFYSPKHHSSLKADNKPDIRTTLFWEPNIKVENNKEVLLNYYNSDNPSKVKVLVEGITTRGIPVTGVTEYEVK